VGSGSGDAGRVVYAGLKLLDRQIVDRNGVMCGNVDDLELTRGDSGRLYVSAIFTGPGELAYRLRRRRLGRWLHEVNRLMWGGRSDGADPDPNRVPMESVSDIDNHVTIALDRDQVGTWSLDDWARRHVISHIPGSRHEAE
jgi:sporulation protein YlmC with PRC-barrel domain